METSQPAGSDTQTSPTLLCLVCLLVECIQPVSTWEWLLLQREAARVPRKEVIQPHLPVRLPCYDFTPITNPTLDACLPNGLAQRLQVLPTFVV